MNNGPEEIRVIKQRESEADNNDEYKEGNHIVLVKKVIPVDENGNRIKYSSSDSSRHYNMPAWTVLYIWSSNIYKWISMEMENQNMEKTHFLRYISIYGCSIVK